MSDHVQRYLKTQELYDAIIVLVPEHTLDRIGETAVRGKLDALLSMGKIEGRLTAIDNDGVQLMQTWRHKGDPDYFVQVTDAHHGVAYRHVNCTCKGVKKGIHVSRSPIKLFRQDYELWSPPDRLIEDWQRIVDSV